MRTFKKLKELQDMDGIDDMDYTWTLVEKYKSEKQQAFCGDQSLRWRNGSSAQG